MSWWLPAFWVLAVFTGVLLNRYYQLEADYQEAVWDSMHRRVTGRIGKE